jgi:hypothetical protein
MSLCRGNYLLSDKSVDSMLAMCPPRDITINLVLYEDGVFLGEEGEVPPETSYYLTMTEDTKSFRPMDYYQYKVCNIYDFSNSIFGIKVHRLNVITSSLEIFIIDTKNKILVGYIEDVKNSFVFPHEISAQELEYYLKKQGLAEKLIR